MKRIWIGSLALAALAGASGAAKAQDGEASTGSTFDEIVVTTQLREQPLKDVPIAVTAFGAGQIEELGIARFEDLAAFTPGLEIQEQSPNNTGFSIRGVTSDSGSAVDEARVALFQDGVSISRSRGSYVEFFDMERVEVAKGPQPTLFGRGALIGAVSLIQNKANLEEFGGDYQIAVGEDGYRRLVGVVNAPVVDGVAGVRLAVTNRARDGFVDNVAGDRQALRSTDLWAFRVAGRLEPTDALTVDLILNWQEDDNSGTSFKALRFGSQGADRGKYSAQGANTIAGLENNKPLGLERTVYGATLLARYEISDALTLDSITGFRKYNSIEVFDPDGFDWPLLASAEDADGEQLSQEFRLTFDDGGALRWLLGYSMFNENNSWRIPLATDERAFFLFSNNLVASPNPGPFAAATNPALLAGIVQAGLRVPAPLAQVIAGRLKPAHIELFRNYGEAQAYDLFGEVSYDVTPRLELTAGVRITSEEKRSGYEAALLNGGSVLASLLAPPAGAFVGQLAVNPNAAALPIGLLFQPTNGATFQESDDTAGTWRLAAHYDLNDQTALWASYARGRRPSVLQPSGPTTPFGSVTFALVPEELVDALEGGVKTRQLDGRLSLDASVFYYDYSDFQTTVIEGGRFVTRSAGKANSYGLDLVASYQVIDGLELFGSYGYNKARFDGGAFDGNRFRGAPDHSGAVGLRFEQPVGEGVIRVIPTYTFQSEVFFADNNDKPQFQVRSPAHWSDTVVDERQAAHGLLNLRAEWAAPGDVWSVGVFGTNLLDQDYLVDAGNTGDSFGIPTFIRGAPRLIGVELKGSF